jgi:hypothetical protein
VNLGNGAGREQRPQHIERGALGPDPVEPRASPWPRAKIRGIA